MSSPRFVVDPLSNAKLMREVSQPANSGACDAKRAKESSQTQQKNIDRCMSDPRGQKRHEQEKNVAWRRCRMDASRLLWSRLDHGRQESRHSRGVTGLLPQA